MTRLLPRSLRNRLLLIVLSAVVATAAFVTIVSVQVIAGFLDSRLHQRTDAIAAQIASVADRSPDRTADATALRTFLPAGSFVLLQPSRGDPVGFGTDELDASFIATQGETLGDREFRQEQVVSAQGQTLTIALVKVDTDGLRVRLEGLTDPVTTRSIVFATDITQDVLTLRQLILLEGSAGAVVILIVGVVTIVITRASVRPLTTMAAAADAITSGDRSQRLEAGAGTEIDHLARSVNRALDAQQRAEETLRTFLDDVSHELRTPLTTINGWIDLYLQGGLQDDEQRDGAMERVESEITRMRMLVDELTLLSRLDAHRPLDAEAVDLARLAREVVDDARVISDDRLISLRPEAAWVVGDPARLAQVLRNLVGNAVQHTPPGTPVGVTVAVSGGEVLLTVDDAGPGIDPRDLPHIFERFWRGEPSRSRATGGSGLGLAIVASIVEAHRGDIRVVSDVGAGTIVTVSLPRAEPGREEGAAPVR